MGDKLLNSKFDNLLEIKFKYEFIISKYKLGLLKTKSVSIC